MAQDSYDVIIIGGGPGGYVAAIRAAQLGLKTAVVERQHLGGICLNWGCIPTKALLRSAELHHTLNRLDEFGLSAENISFDLQKVVARSRAIAGQLNKGVGHLLKKNKVPVIEGHGRLAGDGRLIVGNDGKSRELAARNIIIATGARARELPDLEADGKLVWTYKHAMTPDRMPKSLLVVGSGAIGIEFAAFYRMMGADVTVVEVLDRILPVEDEEISALAEKSFKKQGMRIHTGAMVKALDKSADSVTATIELAGRKTEKLTVDKVIMAVGITGNVEDLGLDEAGVKIENDHIVTDEWGGTGVAGIYAIGDVAGPPWLAHKASHEGVACVERVAGFEGAHPLDKSNIPGCTYSTPQIASVGLTEAQARERGHDIKVGRFPYIGNGKAIALGEPEGLIKTVLDAKTGELLGAHMIGAEVTELIQGYAVAKTLETTEAELMQTVFPHPTLSEMMHESVLDAFGRAVHF
ncbi:MAG: dihydrolipoyl dehydrogenase [Sphingomonadales bacterium]